MFCFISATTLVKPSDLYTLARHIEPAAQNLCWDWHVSQPSIEVFDTDHALPDFCIPVYFMDDKTEWALATHNWDPVRHMPASHVYVNKATGLLSGDSPVSVAASHEVLEALIDPRCDLWTSCPGRPGVDISYEVCDPVQDSYMIGECPVANYVLPAYFSDTLRGPFDHLGTLGEAGSIGPVGYAVFRDKTHSWMEYASGAFEKELPVGSRRARRLA